MLSGFVLLLLDIFALILALIADYQNKINNLVYLLIAFSLAISLFLICVRG